MIRKSHIIGVAAVIALLWAGAASAEVVFFDDLEDPPGLNFWTQVYPEVAPLTWSTDQSVSPTHSAKTTLSQSRMWHSLGGPGMPQHGVWAEWAIYDSDMTRTYGELRGTVDGTFAGAWQNILACGKYNNAVDWDATKYSCRVVSGATTGWYSLNAAGAPSRSTGWHKFAIEIPPGLPGTVNFYVDGKLGRTFTGITVPGAGWNLIVMGFGTASTSNGTSYYDDIKYGTGAYPLCDPALPGVNPAQPPDGPPLTAGDTVVTVAGVVDAADKVTIYKISGGATTEIGSNTSPGVGNVDVNVNLAQELGGLVAGDTIIATQWQGLTESCVAQAGVEVGSCSQVGYVTVQPILWPGKLSVDVSGVSGATAVTIYQNGSPIGTVASPADGTVTVPVDIGILPGGLTGGTTITATQTLAARDGKTLEGCPSVGLTVGACDQVDDVTVLPILWAGRLDVEVSGVNNASAVTIYQNGSAVGTLASPTNGTVIVPVDTGILPGGLTNGATVTATQSWTVAEGVTLEGCQSAGLTVGDPNQFVAVSVGWAAEGMTSVVIGDILAGADSITVYVGGAEVKTVSSPASPIQVVTGLPAFVKDQVVTARQVYQGIVGNLSAERRVTGPGILEDFQAVTAGTAPNTPASPSQRVWYGVGDNITTVIANRTDIDGTSAMAVTDHGWTNGVYAVYRHVFPAAGQYHLEMQMWVDERDVATNYYMSYQVGVVLNGAHRAPGTLLTACGPTNVADYTGLLTAAQDGVGVDAGPYTVLTPTINAQPGDSLLIAFSTNCTSNYMVSGAADPASYPGMLIDNIKINVGPKPCSASDVKPVGIAPYDANTLLVAGTQKVLVTGADVLAKSVQVYEYIPPPAENWRLIGSATAGSASVMVNLDEPLYAGEMVVATQTMSLTDCTPPGDYEGAKPKSGPVVGKGKNSALQLSLGIRNVPNPAGGCNVGEDGKMAGTIDWITATGKDADEDTPLGGYVLQPSADWQTVTFNKAANVNFGFTGNGQFVGPCYTLEELSIASGSANSGFYTLYIDNVKNGTTVIEDFDAGHVAGDLVLFQKPYPNEQLTPGYLENLITPPNVAEVVSGMGVDGSQCLKVQFQYYDEASTRWFRLVTGSTTTEPINPTPNPIVNVNDPITFEIKFEGDVCNPLVFADDDGDGDVDQVDFAAFQACYTGSPSEGYTPTVLAGCSCFDNDSDNDVDSDDAGDFEACASGAGITADTLCDGAP